MVVQLHVTVLVLICYGFYSNNLFTGTPTGTQGRFTNTAGVNR